MAIANEIKCARCDRKYSGVRSRCPYCGARRIGRGKYTEDSDNAKGKMLIGVLILAVFAVGAIVLLLSSDPSQDDPGAQEPEIVDPTPPDNYIPPEPIPTPIDTPPPTIAPLEVTSIIITYGNNPIKDNDFSQPLGVPIELGVRVEPPAVDATVEWEGVTVGDRNWDEVFEFTLVVGGVRITGINTGTARILARAGDKETTVIVRIT